MTKGIGLENVQKRLALLYPNCHQLTITNDGDLYKVVLHLQLMEEQLKRLERLQDLQASISCEYLIK